MIKQTILPFKFEITDEKLTAHAGLVLVAEAALALRLPGLFAAELPAAGSGRGYAPWQFGLPVLLMLSGGGRALDDLREIASDSGLRAALALTVPSPERPETGCGESARRAARRG